MQRPIIKEQNGWMIRKEGGIANVKIRCSAREDCCTMTNANSIGDISCNPYAQIAELRKLVRNPRVELGTVLRYAGALANLGMAQAGRDFLAGLDIGSPAWDQQRKDALAALGAAPGGAVQWTSRRRRFAANMEVVARRWPELAALIPDGDAVAACYRLYQDKTGNYQIRDASERNLAGGWLSEVGDHKASVKHWTGTVTPASGQVLAPVAFDGAGYGWLLIHGLQATEHLYLNYACAVYVVEPDPAALAMLLHLHDLRPWLEQPRFRLFVGPEAGSKFEASFNDRHWSIPNYIFANPLTERPALELLKIARTQAARRDQERRELQLQSEAYYADKDAAYWRERYDEALSGRGERLRILGITSRFSTVLKYSMAELAEAARALGHEFELSMESDDQSLERDDAWLVANFKPDLVVQISRLRNPTGDVPLKAPFLCWDQDNLPVMREASVKDKLTEYMYIAGYGAHEGYHRYGWPLENCIFCHLAGATHRYHAGPLADGPRMAVCDFSYVSNASASPEAFLESLEQKWAPLGGEGVMRQTGRWLLESRDLFAGQEKLLAQIRTAARDQSLQMTARAEGEIGVELTRLADRLFRHEALGWVAEYCRGRGKSLRLYGQGWEDNPEFREFACGPIEPGEPMRALYQQTRINLQLIHAGFLHSRSLDGLAAGGFFLTRRSPADQTNDPKMKDFFLLARRFLELGYGSWAEVVSSTDPTIREQIRRLDIDRDLSDRDYYKIDYLYIVSQIAIGGIFFEDLPAISFGTREELYSLAERYLSDEPQRRSMGEKMRQVVEKEFSYDARFKWFAASIRRGFAAYERKEGR